MQLSALLLVLAMAPVDFDTEVLPVLTKAGCNAGACHGAAAGRGGFALSLFGGDPAADHRAITAALEGRRVNLARPERSLILLKPTWQLDHEGGQRFEEESQQATLLLDWIREGAVRRPGRKLLRLEVAPADTAVKHLPAEIALQVTAHFGDGTSRDVSSLAVYTPADPAASTVNERGEVQVLRPGRHAIIVRFLTHVRAVSITAPFPHEPIDLIAAPRGNWIDDEVYEGLEALHVRPAPRADDATLLRRITLDLTGRFPTPQRIRAYLADKGEGKYAAEVDRLIASGEFTEYWTYKLARWLRVRMGPNDAAGTQAFHGWLKEQMAANRPLDELARELIVAEGDSHRVGPANFHRNAADARSQAEYVTESLLGIRLRCANCHNHPLDRWTQDDYHGLAAIFAGIERGQVVRLRSGGEVIHPTSGEAATPRIPGERFLPPGGDHRRELAEWLTSREHRRFAAAQVNRLWHALMGRGLIDPVDDLRETNPASHPALLARLANDFVEHGHDLRHTLRLIATSAAYQRSSRAVQQARSGGRYYAHALVRPLPPEVLLDAVCDATGVPEEMGNPLQQRRDRGGEYTLSLPLGTRAVSVFTPHPLMDPLGPLAPCTPTGDCSLGEEGGSTLDDLAPQLHWLNGPLVNGRIRQPECALVKLAASDMPAKVLIEEYYLRTLSRPPTAAEQAFWQAELAQGDRARKSRDLAWALLSSREFATNH